MGIIVVRARRHRKVEKGKLGSQAETLFFVFGVVAICFM